MILVSACLVGKFCRYDGLTNKIEDLAKQKENFILCCPEELGNLPTPRPPAEIINATAKDVLMGNGKVLTINDVDVTEAFLVGAYKTLDLAKTHDVKVAILKESSPSCGSCFVYDGTFKGIKQPGEGLTTALLRKNGITVYSEKNYKNR